MGEVESSMDAPEALGPILTTECSSLAIPRTTGWCATLGVQAGATRVTSTSPDPMIAELPQTQPPQMELHANPTHQLRALEVSAVSSLTLPIPLAPPSLPATL